MLIATKNFDKEKVYSLRNDTAGMRDYVKSLIPDVYKHSDSIFNNQLYFIYVSMLGDSTYSMEDRQLIANALMKKVKVTGYINQFLTVGELERFVNPKRLDALYKGDTK